MSPEQREVRDERVAIITAEGISERVAHDICNRYPELYGFLNLVQMNRLQKGTNSRISTNS